MIYRVFSIHDAGVGAYAIPFHVNHVAYALRYFETLARDPKSDVSKFPSQFTLFEIGEFDDSNGVMTAHANHINHGLASNLLSEE